MGRGGNADGNVLNTTGNARGEPGIPSSFAGIVANGGGGGTGSIDNGQGGVSGSGRPGGNRNGIAAGGGAGDQQNGFTPPSSNTGGNGGDGRNLSSTWVFTALSLGEAGWFGGGAAGINGSGGGSSFGGQGGGADGINGQGVTGNPGQPNTGGGGSERNQGTGGSGIIAIRYLI